MTCPECGGHTRLWYRSINSDFRFHHCTACQLIFRDPPLWQVIDYSSYGKAPQKADWAIAAPDAEKRVRHLHGKLHDGLVRAGATLAGKRFLEIGCGPGLLLNRLAREYPDAELYGLDPTSHHAPVEGYTRLTGTIEDAVLPGQFDVIAMFGNFMLHRSPARSLSIIADALNPGGVLIYDYKNPKAVSRQLVRFGRAAAPLSRRAFARFEKQAFHGINFAPTEALQPLNGHFSVISVTTSHSLASEIGRGVIPTAVRAADSLGQRAWVNVIAVRQ